MTDFRFGTPGKTARGAATGGACGAALAAAVTLFAAFVFGLGADNDLYRSYDFREIFTYQRAYYRAALLGGRLPLWTPHTFAGWPFAANPLTETFYPPSLLMLVLPQPAAIAADLVLHLALAALGTYLLLRRSFGLSRAGATFGGLVYPLSGAFVGHADAGHVPFYEAAAYMPWILFALDRAVAMGLRAPWFWIGALLSGLQLLTGGIPYVWITILVAGLLRAGTVLCRTPRDPRAWTREAAVLAGILVLGAGLAAVQLLPTYELIRLSSRAHPDWEYAAEGSFPPALLPILVFPRHAFAGRELYWEYYGYPGALPLLLALASVALARREPRVLVLWTIAGLAVLFALGRHSVLFPLLWRHAPGFASFRVPARAVVVLGLAVSLASALVLDALTASTASRTRALLVVAVSTVTFVDVTLAARANRHRLFLPGSETPADPILVDTLRRDPSWHRFWFVRSAFRANHAYALGARTVGGYDNLILDRYSRFLRFMTGTPLTSSMMTELPPRMFADTSTPFPFKILGVKYATYRGRLWTLPESDPVRRAWFVTAERRFADESEALSYIRSDGFRPRDEVVFDASDAPPPDGPPTEEPPAVPPDVVVSEVSPEHLRIEIGAHGNGFLVLSEIFYPGWRATAGGRELAIYRGDAILRCVRLAGDEHEVDMMYAPRALRLGAALSAASAVIVLGGAIVGRRRDVS